MLLSLSLELIPEASRHPVNVFNCLQYAKTVGWRGGGGGGGGGRPGPFYHVNDINVYLDRQRGSRGGPYPAIH